MLATTDHLSRTTGCPQGSPRAATDHALPSACTRSVAQIISKIRCKCYGQAQHLFAMPLFEMVTRGPEVSTAMLIAHDTWRT